jgi:hypothetical protein
MSALSGEAAFRQTFPQIIAVIDAVSESGPETEWILVESFATRAGRDYELSVIFRNVETGRGFGCT